MSIEFPRFAVLASVHRAATVSSFDPRKKVPIELQTVVVLWTLFKTASDMEGLNFHFFLMFLKLTIVAKIHLQVHLLSQIWHKNVFSVNLLDLL